MGCHTGSSFIGIEPMGLPSPRVGHDYYSQQCLSCMTNVEKPFLSSTGKSSLMHFNGTETGIVFTSHFHDIYYLSFRLKCEGMNFLVENFIFLWIIGYINMIITKMNNMFAHPKEHLNSCRDMLQLVFKDTQEIF